MSQKPRQNCWEAKNCGREPGGRKADELGICAAAVEDRLEGVHGGYHGGRACWVIAGTLCGGAVQGTAAEKEGNCMLCDVYKMYNPMHGTKKDAVMGGHTDEYQQYLGLVRKKTA